MKFKKSDWRSDWYILNLVLITTIIQELGNLVSSGIQINSFSNDWFFLWFADTSEIFWKYLEKFEIKKFENLQLTCKLLPLSIYKSINHRCFIFFSWSSVITIKKVRKVYKWRSRQNRITGKLTLNFSCYVWSLPYQFLRTQTHVKTVFIVAREKFAITTNLQLTGSKHPPTQNPWVLVLGSTSQYPAMNTTNISMVFRRALYQDRPGWILLSI